MVDFLRFLAWKDLMLYTLLLNTTLTAFPRLSVCLLNPIGEWSGRCWISVFYMVDIYSLFILIPRAELSWISPESLGCLPRASPPVWAMMFSFLSPKHFVHIKTQLFSPLSAASYLSFSVQLVSSAWKSVLNYCCGISIFKYEEIHSLTVLLYTYLIFWSKNPNPDKEKPPCNAQELEECDIFFEESSSLCRFDGSTLKTTHVVSSW